MMFSAGRLLSTVRTKLGHPAVFACEEIASVTVSYNVYCAYPMVHLMCGGEYSCCILIYFYQYYLGETFGSC